VAVWLKALECTVINDSLDRIHGYPWVNFPPLGSKSSCWMLENLNLPGHSGCSGKLPPQSDRVIGVRSLVKMGHPTVSLHIGACPHEKEDISWKKKSAVVWEGECWYSRYVLSASSSTWTCSSSCRFISWTHPSLGEPGALQTTPKVARLLEHRRSEIPRSRETRRLDTPNLFSHLPGSTSWQAVQ
jgi:hypothetical protein